MENPDGLTPLAVRRLGAVQVEVVVGSLADSLGVAAVVNPTSASMGLDGGVGFSLAQRANGVELAEACRKLAPLEVARAVVTPGFGLPTANIIHCRGPRRTDHDAVDKLVETYWSVFSLAEERGFPSIAVPAISSGLKGFSLEESARIAIEALKSSSPEIRKLRKIIFVLPKPSAADIFARELLQPPRFPNKGVRLTIPVIYSPTEIQRLRQGHFGDHDTKWFFYHEEPWLCVYRGNREHGGWHFWLKLPERSGHSPLVEAFMNEEMEQFWGPKTEAEALVEYLLADRFELLRVTDEDDDCQRVGNVRVAIRHGKIALDSSPDSVGLLPSELARELGDKLLRLADVLEQEMSGE